MTWMTVGVTVAGAAANAYSQNRAQKNAQSAQNQAMAAAGKIPKIASYEEVDLKPVNFQSVQRDTLDGNYNMVGLIQQLMQANSGINRSTSMDRANAFSPALWGNVGATAGIASEYLAGRPSWSDSMETVARSTGLTGSVGTPGTGAALTARDLGLMDMDLRARGAEMNAQAIQQGEALDPRSNYGTPQDWQLTPREAVPWKVDENLKLSSLAMQQAENVYTAEQNGYNIAAGMNPAAMAGLAFSKEANQGVNWGQLIEGLGTAYNGYRTNSGAAGLNTGGYTRQSGGNYVPRAQVVT